MAINMSQGLKKMIERLNIETIRLMRLKRSGQHQALQQAMIRAYNVWAPQNWEWVDSLFNEHFLTHRATPVLARYLDDSRRPDAVELANAWAEQLSWFDVELKRQHIAKLIPAAAHFLRCLDVELGVEPTFRPVFEPVLKTD